jgi:hypothetical protein
MFQLQFKTRNNALNNIWAMIQKEYWCLIWNMNMQSASSIWSNLLNYYQMPRSISSKLFVIASGEANVYGSSYYWNFRTSSFKQVACLILHYIITYSWPTPHINGMYVCVLGIPKCKFSKQMIKKYLVTEYLFITDGEFLF